VKISHGALLKTHRSCRNAAASSLYRDLALFDASARLRWKWTLTKN